MKAEEAEAAAAAAELETTAVKAAAAEEVAAHEHARAQAEDQSIALQVCEKGSPNSLHERTVTYTAQSCVPDVAEPA